MMDLWATNGRWSKFSESPAQILISIPVNYQFFWFLILNIMLPGALLILRTKSLSVSMVFVALLESNVTSQ
jgi:hypothetical protein